MQKKIDETLKTKRMKHLQKYLKIFENHYKHMQHPDETFANIRVKHLKALETYACNMHVYATSRFTFATSR